MEEALSKFSLCKSNLSAAATGVNSCNSALLSAGSSLKAAIDAEIKVAQATAATTTGVAVPPATQAQPSGA